MVGTRGSEPVAHSNVTNAFRRWGVRGSEALEPLRRGEKNLSAREEHIATRTRRSTRKEPGMRGLRKGA